LLYDFIHLPGRAFYYFTVWQALTQVIVGGKMARKLFFCNGSIKLLANSLGL